MARKDREPWPDRAFNDDEPLALPDDLDVAMFGRLLRKIEFTADRKGWHQDYAGLGLYVLYDVTAEPGSPDQPPIEELFNRFMGANPKLGPALKMGNYRAQSFLPAEWLEQAGTGPDMDGKPWRIVRRFAENVTYGPPDDFRPAEDPAIFRQIMRVPGVLGFACVYEAWDRSHIEGAIKDVIAPQWIDWGTLEGSETVRVAMAVDFLDRVHKMARSMATGLASDVHCDGDIRGDLSTTLRVLTDMAYSRSPPSVALLRALHDPAGVPGPDDRRGRRDRPGRGHRQRLSARLTT